MSRQQILIALVLIFYSIAGSLYIANVPLFEASDEAEHFIHIHTILETNALPIIQSREQMANQPDPILRWNNQSHHAPLYYMTSALLVSWSDRADLTDYLHPNELIFLRNTVDNNPNKWLHRYGTPTSDTHLAIYSLRIFNLLIGVGTLLMVFGCGYEITQRDDVPLLAMLFTASIPTFIVVNTSVTNDALVIFLYTSGLYWVLKAWRTATFSAIDITSISLILAGIALTKLTGVTLFGVVYLVLIVGIWREKWQWQKVAQMIVITGIISAVLSGWWYLRNLQLYGDLLAANATASIWGRENPLTLAIFAEDVFRVAKSFWMMIGYLHNPVYVTDAFYVYAGILTVVGLGGAYIYTIQNKQFDTILILCLTCFVVSAMLLYGTLSVDISYGRLLHPAIGAFAALMMIGLVKLTRNFAFLFILPLSVTSVIVPLLIVPQAYPSLIALDTPPETITPVEWQADTLEIVGIDVPKSVVNTGDTITVDLYFRGNHPDNPALTVTAVDTIRVERFDHVEIYPGMADMRYLPDEQLYQASINLEITEPDTILPPRLVNVLVVWVDLDTNEKLIFDKGESLLEVPSVTYVDERYSPPERDSMPISFGDEIIMQSLVVTDRITAGEQLSLSFIWEATESLATDTEAILTLQILDSDGNLITQEDGTMWWYPTTAWAENMPFEDVRTVDIPDDVEAGNYQLAIGWYRAIDDTYPRLSVSSPQAQHDLYLIPITILAQ